MTDRRRYSKAELNTQTARLSWPELEPHFARGVVLRVAPEIDLVEVATCFANDDKPAVEQWLSEGAIRHLDTGTASRWRDGNPDLWAVVVAPWVVVQEREE